MTDAPLVSVIIPLYNCEQYIEACVNAVIRQTYTNLQIIVINDGSADNSLGIVSRIKDERLQIVSNEKNLGNSKTMNRGLMYAKGAYIKYTDADDIMNPTHIEGQLALIAGKNDEVASCKWARFTNNIEEAIMVPELVWQSMDTISWIKTALAQESDMTPGWLWLLPRAVVDAAGPWNETLSINNDYEYSTRILMASKRVNFSERSVLYYRNTPNSVTKQQGYKVYNALYNANKLAVGNLLKKEDSREMRRLLANRYQFILYGLYPRSKELQEKIRKEIDALGGSDLKFTRGQSGKLAIVTNIIGWKMARRLQYLYYKYRYKLQ
jgi:glycosyltransferase involved in cell wall biosynthesis